MPDDGVIEEEFPRAHMEWQCVIEWSDGHGSSTHHFKKREDAEAFAADPWPHFPGMAAPTARGNRRMVFNATIRVRSRLVTEWADVELVDRFPTAPDIEPEPRFAGQWRFKPRV